MRGLRSHPCQVCFCTRRRFDAIPPGQLAAGLEMKDAHLQVSSIRRAEGEGNQGECLMGMVRDSAGSCLNHLKVLCLLTNVGLGSI